MLHTFPEPGAPTNTKRSDFSLVYRIENELRRNNSNKLTALWVALSIVVIVRDGGGGGSGGGALGGAKIPGTVGGAKFFVFDSFTCKLAKNKQKRRSYFNRNIISLCHIQKGRIRDRRRNIGSRIGSRNTKQRK